MNQTVRGFFKKELMQAVRDRRMRVMLFVMPVIQMLLFGLALSNEIKHVRLAVVRAPEDTLAQHIEERALASGWFDRARVQGPDPFHWIQSGEADAVLIVPEGGLTRAAGRERGQAQLLVEASNAVRARGIETYMNAVLAMVAKEGSVADSSPPISFDIRILYNPEMSTPVYLVPGVMCLILSLLTVILTSMALAREKEVGTFETLISAPVKIWEILLGKTLPYVLIGMIDVPLVIGVAMFFFGVPLRGAFWQIGLSSLVFTCTAVATGTLISTFARNQQQAMMGGFLFMFPGIQLSGIMFPLENMPRALIWVRYFNPLSYFVVVLRNIMLKGGEPSVVWSNLAGIGLIGLLLMIVTFRRFHRTLN